MGNPAQRTAHIKDTIDFFNAIENNTLPAVSFVKPDGLLDGHPASSKLGLLEGMTKKIFDRLKAHPDLMATTAFIVTMDEGGRLLRLRLYAAAGLLWRRAAHSIDHRFQLH